MEKKYLPIETGLTFSLKFLYQLQTLIFRFIIVINVQIVSVQVYLLDKFTNTFDLNGKNEPCITKLTFLHLILALEVNISFKWFICVGLKNISLQFTQMNSKKWFEENHKLSDDWHVKSNIEFFQALMYFEFLSHYLVLVNLTWNLLTVFHNSFRTYKFDSCPINLSPSLCTYNVHLKLKPYYLQTFFESLILHIFKTLQYFVI